MFQHVTAQKNLTATFIANVRTAMGEQQIEVQNSDTGGKRTHAFWPVPSSSRVLIISPVNLKPVRIV